MSSEEFLKKANHALSIEAHLQFKTLKQIGYEALQEFKSLKDPKIEDLKNYGEILKIVKSGLGKSNKFQLELAKLAHQYHQLLGWDEPRILLEKSTEIELGSGIIAIGDPSFSIADDESFAQGDLESHLIKLINCGKGYFFGTGSDGPFDIDVQIIEGQEPALSSMDYKNVVGASPIVILNFQSGKFAMDDGIISPSNNQIEINIAPGNYKCQIFIVRFPDSDDEYSDYSYYTVLTKCEESASNFVSKISNLEPDF